MKGNFNLLILPHVAEALAYARSLVGNEADAEDVCQEACLRAFRGVDRLEGRDARKWLMRLVRRQATRRLSQSSRLESLHVDLEAFEAAQEVASATAVGVAERPDAAFALANRDVIDQALAQLPDAFRETIVQREMLDRSYREIAEASGVPIGTVMSRLARARRMLKDALIALEQGS